MPTTDRYPAVPYLAMPGHLKPFTVLTESGDPIRVQIMSAVATRLATITTANGYETDIGNNVFEWRDHPLDADTELPGLMFRDERPLREAETIGSVINTLPLTVRICCTTSATMRKAVADVIKCVGADVYWSGLAQDTRLPEEEDEVYQADAKYFEVTMVFDILYNTERFNEYA